MDLKQWVIRTIDKGLPHEEQELMVTDFLNWLFSDCTPTERQENVAFLKPKLVEDISKGKYGLWLLSFQYMKYLVSLCWVRHWFNPMAAPKEDHITR